MSWGGGGGIEIDSPLGADDPDPTRWIETRSYGPEARVRVAFRMSPATFAALINDLDQPLWLRWAAVRDLPRAKMSDADMLALITTATADPSAIVRALAIRQIEGRSDIPSYFPVLRRAILDPCPGVSESAVFSFHEAL
jgi:hypothetical protein